jgi:uncharacterized ion transporter superfamily protein YfcC
MKNNLKKKVIKLEKRIFALEKRVQVQPKECAIKIDDEEIAEYRAENTQEVQGQEKKHNENLLPLMLFAISVILIIFTLIINH